MICGHEVECAVFGGGGEPVKASGVGEILAAAQFYDYDAKYNNAESRTVTDPDFPAMQPVGFRRLRKIFSGLWTATDLQG